MIKGLRVKRFIVPVLLIGVSLLVFVYHREIEEKGTLRWYDRTFIFLTSPLTRGVLLTREWVSHLFQRYLFLIGVEEENEDLRQRIRRHEEREIILRSVEEENRRLLGLMSLPSRYPGEWKAARVISYPPVTPHRLLTIDKGSSDGITLRCPVIASEGLVGQVARVTDGSSQVLLITDPTSAVDGRMEATGIRGLIVGKVISLKMGHQLYLSAFEYLNRASEIKEGEPIVTSGLDGIFPGGLLIGHVKGPEKKKYDVFQEAQVIPSVDFNQLQEVLVLVR